MITFNDLKKNLKKDFSTLKTVKVAVLGDFSTQLLVQAIKGYGYEVNINFEIFEADFDQIEIQVFDYASELYKFKPEFILIFQSVQKLSKSFYKRPLDRREEFHKEVTHNLDNIYNIAKEKLDSKIIVSNFQEIDDGVYGNYANKISSSFLYQIRKINLEIMNLSVKHKDLFVSDINLLQSHFDDRFVFDPKIYMTAEMILSLDFLPAISKNTVRIIQAIRGEVKKCLILDLDNLLWGGVLGDEGVENIQVGSLGIGKAFTNLQIWAKELKTRGIILAVCSQNDEKTAKDVFLNHPEMILKLDDFAVFVANWDSKVENIKYIQSVLNVGFDSMVFLDDNPYERELVKKYLPEVTVPDLPEDPAEYLLYLQTLDLFETASISEEDQKRTKQYQQEALRTAKRKNFSNEGDFLESLEMEAKVESFNKFNTPRVAQLSQRSNQFNLRTIRYTEADVAKLSKDERYTTLAFSLKDKFGDYGLVSVVILERRGKEFFIDTWLMSCRVLKRTMENFVLNRIVREAGKYKITTIGGEYIKTAKNDLVKDHYKNLGFKLLKGRWILEVDRFKIRPTYINLAKSDES